MFIVSLHWCSHYFWHGVTKALPVHGFPLSELVIRSYLISYTHSSWLPIRLTFSQCRGVLNPFYQTFGKSSKRSHHKGANMHKRTFVYVDSHLQRCIPGSQNVRRAANNCSRFGGLLADIMRFTNLLTYLITFCILVKFCSYFVHATFRNSPF